MKNEQECVRRKSFKWMPLTEEKFELQTPESCTKCEDDLSDCMEKSWAENGRKPDAFKNVTVLVNMEPKTEPADENPKEILEEKSE